MPKTATVNEYSQKSKEELGELKQEWQGRVDQAPIPISRGTWIATKSAIVGVLAAIPSGIAGFLVKEKSLRNETQKAETGFLKSITNFSKEVGNSALNSGKIEKELTEEGEKHLKDIEKATETMLANAKKATTTAKYSALGGGLAVAAIAAYGMIKRRRAIISDKADVEVLKIDNAIQGKELEDATEKAKHAAADPGTKLEKVQSAEKADHDKIIHAEKAKHAGEHEKEHGEGGITQQDMELLNERLAAGKHGEKEHSKDHEKKDLKAHAERSEHETHHGR